MSDSSKEMVKIICKAMDAKQAVDVEVIEIGEVSTIADYFVICNGNNTPQVDAIVDSVEYEMYKAGFNGARMEGAKNASGWILMDFGDVVVHVFAKEDRSFYNLERIWKDGKKVDPASL